MKTTKQHITSSKYTVNGQEYDSFEDLPPEAQQVFRDHKPDFSTSHTTTKKSFTVNGKTYDSFDALPAKIRAALDKNNNGVPDFSEDHQQTLSTSKLKASHASGSTNITQNSNQIFRFITIIAALVVGGAMVLWQLSQ